LLALTSQDNPQHYLDDFEVWRQRLEEDCYDSYTLDRCEIEDTSFDPDRTYSEGDEVTVTFTARMKEKDSGNVNSFKEVSTFRREEIGGGDLGWLYQFGDVD